MVLMPSVTGYQHYLNWMGCNSNQIHQTCVLHYYPHSVSGGSDPSVAIRKVALFDTSAEGSGRQ